MLSQRKEFVVPVTRAEISAIDRLVAMVKENKGKPFCGDLSKFERELKERLDAVCRELVASELAKADGTRSRGHGNHIGCWLCGNDYV